MADPDALLYNAISVLHRVARRMVTRGDAG